VKASLRGQKLCSYSALPRINEFYPTETETIRCRPQGKTAAQFDPVLVVVQPSVTDIHSVYNSFEHSLCSLSFADRDSEFEGYHVAELHLVFRTRKDPENADVERPFYAYVLWYTVIPPTPVRDIKLYRVEKDISLSRVRRGGIVLLEQITQCCPLVPSISGPCPTNRTSENCYESFNSFYINAFASHSNYCQLQ
jgi:hypothetical protein